MRELRCSHIIVTSAHAEDAARVLRLLQALGFEAGEATGARSARVSTSPWAKASIDPILAKADPAAIVILVVPDAEPERSASGEGAALPALYGLIERLANGGHRHVLISATRANSDAAYCYRQLQCLFATCNISPSDVANALARLDAQPAGTAQAQTYPARDPAPFIEDMLGASFVTAGPWKHADRALEKIDSSYYDIWRQIPGGHKKYAYFTLYDRLFTHLRGRSLNVLEIGVYKGASLKAWRRYLGNDARIVGIDLRQACRASDDPANGIHVRIGSQADASFLSSVVAEFGPFDVIMDDGSHQTAHQIESFKHLFTDGLKSGGIYFLEDINTSFWPTHRNGPYDVFDLLNACMLGMNHFYLDHRPEDFAAASHPGVLPAIALNRLVREVRVFDSACAIYKSDDTVYPTLVIHT